MSPFMILIQENAAGDSLTPSETRKLLEARAAYEESLRSASSYGEGERLRPPAEGRRVSRRDGVSRVPQEEPALAGYYLVDAPDLEAAVELARCCPVAPGDELEVRPVMKGAPAPDRASERGRVFAFAVLGSAPDEQSFIDVMDRIDASTDNRFPPGRFLGGVRLDAPGRGGRLARGGRAVFDGPFLESKEVIGGLFFMRAGSLDEAVEWAQGSGFVKHGVLEIRELWRS